MSGSRTLVAALAALVFTAVLPAAAQEGDPFMGDWEGTLKTAAGAEKPLCAQVICWGREGYQANLLEAFDQRKPAVAVLRGKAEDGRVLLGEQARIAGGAFTGTLDGDWAGAFTLKRVVRLSPTLGLKPPAGAVVLMAGGDLEEWQAQGDGPFVVDLGKAIGGENRAAYLRARLWSPRAQPARLEVGSDDGVKAWVNGTLVHANNTPRGVTPWEDKADVDLKEGWNELLLKVVQGGGGWAACARVLGRDGTSLDGLKLEPMPQIPEGASLAAFQGGCSGTVIAWQVAGPFSEEGKEGPTALFDVVFPPEEAGKADVEWRVVNDKPAPPKRWRAAEENAVEVTPGAGSLVARRQFKDFRLHLEFRTPFMPDARGQGRGNSGVYLQGRYEIQVLDSYGLEGKNNECGGWYSVAEPRVSMCAPPLQWQTYDIDFRAPRYDDGEKRMVEGSMTVRHNGVLIHENLRVPPQSTGGPGYVQAGPILLQDHGNPVRYRNIWILER